jgi:hypothetical protein
MTHASASTGLKGYRLANRLVGWLCIVVMASFGVLVLDVTRDGSEWIPLLVFGLVSWVCYRFAVAPQVTMKDSNRIIVDQPWGRRIIPLAQVRSIEGKQQRLQINYAGGSVTVFALAPSLFSILSKDSRVRRIANEMESALSASSEIDCEQESVFIYWHPIIELLIFVLIFLTIIHGIGWVIFAGL